LAQGALSPTHFKEVLQWRRATLRSGNASRASGQTAFRREKRNHRTGGGERGFEWLMVTQGFSWLHLDI